MKTATVRARVDIELKQQAEAVLLSLGLTTTEAIRLFLQQVRLRRGLPFAVVLPDVDPDVADILHPTAKRAAALEELDDLPTR
ncbi:MAG: type II toxin-antitoxin system RelB/DinJ family antitoxin [Puniceicoccaceae bacterium]